MVFWDVTPCSLVDRYQYSGGTYLCHLCDTSNLKMEAAYSSKTVTYVDVHCPEDLKSQLAVARPTLHVTTQLSLVLKLPIIFMGYIVYGLLSTNQHGNFWCRTYSLFSPFEVEIAVAKLKKYKSPGSG
jgi:hypothetical protein